MNPATTIPGFICGYSFDAGGAASPLAEHDFPFAKNADWIWLHLNLTDQRCARWIMANCKFPPDLVTTFCNPAKRQHLSEHADIMVGHLGDFRQEFDQVSGEGAVLHIMTDNHIFISGRLTALQSAERIRNHINTGKTIATPMNLICEFVSTYVEEVEDFHHSFLDEMEKIEDQILYDRHRGERRRLMFVRRNMAQIHRHLQNYRRTLSHAERTLARYPAALANTTIRLANIDQDFALLEQRARFFHDEIDAKLAAETNRQLYILSVLTATFLPPTLVAGLFGMNLPGIAWAENASGFTIAIGLCALSSAAVGLFLWFANRR